MVFNFHLYGFLIGLGILASCSASAWLARRRGITPDLIWNGLWWVTAPALIGARLYHVADRWSDIYRLNPISSLYIWNGGLGIFGGIIGGFLGLALYFRFQVSGFRFKGSFMQILDIVFFGLPIGQAIGRIGNWVNQEVYGLPTSLPWGIYIKPGNRLPQYANYATFHPLFAYEALWNLFGFAVMLFSEKLYKSSPAARFIRRSYSGFYLCWYGLARFALDFLRPQDFAWFINNLNLGQAFSAALILAGLVIWKINRALFTDNFELHSKR